MPGGPKLPGGTWQIQSDGSIPGMVPLNDSNDLMVGGENEPNGLYRHTTGMEVDSEGKQHFTDGLTNSVSFWGLGGNDFMSGEQYDDYLDGGDGNDVAFTAYSIVACDVGTCVSGRLGVRPANEAQWWKTA